MDIMDTNPPPGIPEEPQVPEVSQVSLSIMSQPHDQQEQCDLSMPQEQQPRISVDRTVSHKYLLDKASRTPLRSFLDICSGVSRPLSTAVLAQGKPVLSFDILLDDSMDLLNDSAFEDLMRLSASGQVAYGAASPACCHYSRLKLRNDHGPPAIRSPEFLSGLPNLLPHQLQQVQESHLMLSRCVDCLSMVFQTGGHAHLEQPVNAMSWLEPVVKRFLLLLGAHCICIPACLYEMDVYKTWMFASSFEPLCSLGGQCPHPPNSHATIQGQIDESGEFASRATARYPSALATKFADVIAPLLPDTKLDYFWHDLEQCIPIKSQQDFPFSQIDGGGLPSHPDWSTSNRIEKDIFATLRKSWLKRILDQRLDKVLIAHLSKGSPDPPFWAEVLQPFVQDLENWLVQHGHSPNWDIRQHQPMYLHILHPSSPSCKIGIVVCFHLFWTVFALVFRCPFQLQVFPPI